MNPKIGIWPVSFEVSNVKNAYVTYLTLMPKQGMKQERFESKMLKIKARRRKKLAFAEPSGKNIKRGESILERSLFVELRKKNHVFIHGSLT